MQLETYLANYEIFNKEFFPDATVEEIENKMTEECVEFVYEIARNGTRENRIAEATDVLNMAIKLLRAYGVLDPLHAGYAKLQQTADKYRLVNNGGGKCE